MKVKEYHQPDLLEDRIDLYYRNKNKEINDILQYLRKHRYRLIGKSENRDIVFSLDEVYYFESVDKKIFAYLKDQVVRIDTCLQDIEDAYYDFGCIRVNKSTVLNVYHIDSLTSELNMKVMAKLDNGEKIQINRSYKARFHNFLKSICKGGSLDESHP